MDERTRLGYSQAMAATRRDPLSVRYDAASRNAVLRAIRRGEGRAVRVWIASPAAEFHAKDAGGRTAHERAFTRSVYYLVWKTPINAGVLPEWSVKLTWGQDDDRQASSRGRLARSCDIRVWPRSKAKTPKVGWRDDPSKQSKLGSDGEFIVPG